MTGHPDLLARRCALQAMYQFDAVQGADPTVVRSSLDESMGASTHHDAGFALACLAWEHRADADRMLAELTPEWPTHRQPIIDRNLLRLGWFELTVSGLPAGLVISDAVELAKEFGSEKTAGFVNGVLDQVARRAPGGGGS